MTNSAKCFGRLGLVAAGMLLVTNGCSTVPITGRQQFNLLPESQEMQLGLSEFQKMKQEIPVSQDPNVNALVQRVGNRIANVATPDMPNAQWEFVVFDSPEANAFCLPGGKVGIYTGILPITLTEEGLATVIGHEVAHAVARHGGARVSTAMSLQALGAVVSATSAQSQYAEAIRTGYGMGAQLGVALPHSRGQEAEADEIGLIYMARAGYRPQAAVEFWERFGEFNRSQGQNTPWFLRTHPMDTQRVANLEKLMPRAMAEYRPQ
jgi:predicted Zn-dependent protease